MASIGHPLLGDPVYGRAGKTHGKLLKELGFHRQALHAAELGFIHPVTKSRLSFASRHAGRHAGTVQRAWCIRI